MAYNFNLSQPPHASGSPEARPALAACSACGSCGLRQPSCCFSNDLVPHLASHPLQSGIERQATARNLFMKLLSMVGASHIGKPAWKAEGRDPPVSAPLPARLPLPSPTASTAGRCSPRRHCPKPACVTLSWGPPHWRLGCSTVATPRKPTAVTPCRVPCCAERGAAAAVCGGRLWGGPLQDLWRHAPRHPHAAQVGLGVWACLVPSRPAATGCELLVRPSRPVPLLAWGVPSLVRVSHCHCREFHPAAAATRQRRRGSRAARRTRSDGCLGAAEELCTGSAAIPWSADAPRPQPMSVNATVVAGSPPAWPA